MNPADYICRPIDESDSWPVDVPFIGCGVHRIYRLTTRKSDVWLRDGWPHRFTLFPRWDAFWKKVRRCAP